MMKKNDTKFRILAIIALILTYSIVVAADKVVIFPYNVSARNAVVQYKIGDTGPAGGKVFFVHTDGQHGLEVVPADLTTTIRWYNGSDTNTEAHGDGVGAGEMNTMLIISNQGDDSNSYAAGFCAKLFIINAGVKYGDWYLASKEELNLLYLQKDVVGGFTASAYWSSTEEDNENAWSQGFDTNGVQDDNLKLNAVKVRCIRSF